MLVELPEESASDPTQQPVKAMWQGRHQTTYKEVKDGEKQS